MCVVSILVPVYGVEKYITRCAESLFQQTYDDIEYIFVNDCTKDRSIEILKDVIVRYPLREKQVHIINHEHNRGLAAARNTAVSNSTGDFLLWVDSDDSLDIYAVEKLVACQQETNADMVCFDAEVRFSDRIIYKKNGDYLNGKELTLKILKGEAMSQIWGRLIRRGLYIENNISAVEGINQAEDYQVTPKLTYYAKVITTLHEVLYHYDRTSETSYSNNFTIKSARQMDRAHRVLCDFFKDKEPDFYEATNQTFLKSVVRRMKSISIREDKEGYYQELLSLLDGFDKIMYKKLSMSNRIIIFLRKKSLVAIYARIHALLLKVR